MLAVMRQDIYDLQRRRVDAGSGADSVGGILPSGLYRARAAINGPFGDPAGGEPFAFSALSDATDFNFAPGANEKLANEGFVFGAGTVSNEAIIAQAASLVGITYSVLAMSPVDNNLPGQFGSKFRLTVYNGTQPLEVWSDHPAYLSESSGHFSWRGTSASWFGLLAPDDEVSVRYPDASGNIDAITAEIDVFGFTFA